MNNKDIVWTVGYAWNDSLIGHSFLHPTNKDYLPLVVLYNNKGNIEYLNTL